MGQSNFLQALGWAVLNSLWQMALLWILYQFITGIFRIRPHQKSLLATTLLLTGFGWFVFTLYSILSYTNNNSVLSGGFITVTDNVQLNQWLNTTLPIASIMYLALLVLPLLSFIRNYRYVQAIRQYGKSKIDVHWRLFVQKFSAQMGIRKPVHVWISELVTSPVTIGYIKPIILLPVAALNGLTTQQLEAVLLHELAHIRRYDYLINLILNVIQTILYFNPFVKAFIKIVEREREKSCDEMVMQFQYDPHGYASALLILEKNNTTFKPLAVAASGKKNDLLHRIEWILGVNKKPVLSFNKLGGLFAGLLCVIALNGLLIISKPSNRADSSVAFNQLSSPFYFFTGDGSKEESTIAPPTDENTAKIENHISRDTKTYRQTVNNIQPPSADNVSAPLTEGIIHAAFQPMIDIPQLKNYQVAQVKEAVEASKKVIEDAQWKALEGKIAEVLTEKEKSQLRTQYKKALEQQDWNKWEDKLRLAYNKVDWNDLTEQLNTAVNNIKLDSLQQAYNETACQLEKVQQALTENNLQIVPDTDITLKQVEQQKREIQRNINSLKRFRTKKVVHL
jgi:bla regulator protein BlaR1